MPSEVTTALVWVIVEDEGKEGHPTLSLHNGRHKFKINNQYYSINFPFWSHKIPLSYRLVKQGFIFKFLPVQNLFVAMRPAGLAAHASPVLLRARGVAALAMPLQQTSPRKTCLCPRCLNEVSSHGNHTLSTQMCIVLRHFALLCRNDVKSEGAEEQERNLIDMQAARAVTLPYISCC